MFVPQVPPRKTPEFYKHVATVATATADGKTIIYRRQGDGNDWSQISSPAFDWTVYDYAVEPNLAESLAAYDEVWASGRVYVHHNGQLYDDHSRCAYLSLPTSGLIPAARRWYTEEEALTFASNSARFFLVKERSTGRTMEGYPTWDSAAAHKFEVYLSYTDANVNEDNFNNYVYSNDLGKTWRRFGVIIPK